jgi:hypothetical protein
MIHLIPRSEDSVQHTRSLDPEDPAYHFLNLDPEDPAISTQPDDEVPLPDVPDDPDLPTDIVVCIFELLFEPSKYVTKTELP